MDDRRNQMDFDLISSDCPWRFDGKDFAKCRPVVFKVTGMDFMAKLTDCKQKNCPIMHFKKYFTRTY